MARQKTTKESNHVARPNPIPEHYRRITSAIVVNGATKALEFYAQVFGAKERSRFPGPDGTVVHSEIEIGDSVLIVEDATPGGSRVCSAVRACMGACERQPC
jgi:hypothetical protein